MNITEQDQEEFRIEYRKQKLIGNIIFASIMTILYCFFIALAMYYNTRWILAANAIFAFSCSRLILQSKEFGKKFNPLQLNSKRFKKYMEKNHK